MYVKFAMFKDCLEIDYSVLHNNMKILWITNILFPEAEHLLTGNGELKASGGWMLGAAEALLLQPNIKLTVATVSTKVKSLTRLEGNRITYYVLPMGRGNQRMNPEYEPLWKHVKSEVRPDVVHIHGTEFSHGHAYMRACGSDNVVVSIQGMTSAYYYYYYYYGMSKSDVYKNLTLRDILRGSIIAGQRQFKKRSEYEVEMLRMAHHVIGRTSWDRTHVWAINPEAEYHFCNETLRPEFYDGSKWSYEKCRKHSIFLSQAGYPIKGLHQLLKAMPLILSHYPDTTIRVAGGDITKCDSFKDWLHFSGYGRYIKNLIHRLHMAGEGEFIGDKNAEEMKQEYLNSNVFVCPSTIENSPNSLGEAQILGVPCVASYVGGIPDMMKGNEDNLYRFEEVEMLAEKICQVFTAKEQQNDMISIAVMRHNPKINSENLYCIYQSVVIR